MYFQNPMWVGDDPNKNSKLYKGLARMHHRSRMTHGKYVRHLISTLSDDYRLMHAIRSGVVGVIGLRHGRSLSPED